MADTNLQPVECLSAEMAATSSSSDLLSTTLRPSKSKQRRSYMCEKCPYTTKRKFNLKRHNKSNCGGKNLREKTLHECRKCGYSTTRSNNLKRHKCRNSTKCGVVKSNNKILHECGRCGYSTIRLRDLKRHKLGKNCQRRHRFTEVFWEGAWCVYSTEWIIFMLLSFTRQSSRDAVFINILFNYGHH